MPAARACGLTGRQRRGSTTFRSRTRRGRLMRVLVVEDEPDLARALARSLTEAGFAVDVAADGEDGLFRIREIPYDAAVLDLMLPRLDGWSVLEAARAEGIRLPILVLTARDQLADRVRGLNLGADDYL